MDISVKFPDGKLTLICGTLGSGKTLLLLCTSCILIRSIFVHTDYIRPALLGEADILAGQVLCPRSPSDALATFTSALVAEEEWVVQGICAYVPQVRPSGVLLLILFMSRIDSLATQCIHQEYSLHCLRLI